MDGFMRETTEAEPTPTRSRTRNSAHGDGAPIDGFPREITESEPELPQLPGQNTTIEPEAPK
jgi:hypothetical protein